MDDRRHDPTGKLVEGVARTPTNFKLEDLGEHLAELRREFAGQGELCYAHAELVVLIRREVELDASLRGFFAMWDEHAEFLAGALNTRWLVSALDTYADHGTPLQRALALVPVTLVAMLKLGETERLVLEDAGFSGDKFEALRRFRQQGFVYLWDGMTAYAMHNGDVLKNLVRRYREQTSTEPVLQQIGLALVARAAEGDTLISRLSVHNPWLLE